MRTPDFRVQSAALVELEGFLKQLQKANPKLAAALQADPSKVMELLSPEDAKKLQSLMMKVSASALSLALKPTPGSKKKDDMLNALSEPSQSAKQDPYSNLLGLILSSQTGALPVVIYCYLGNGLGIVDYNPNNGWAPIDSINEINLQFGDSLGLEQKTIDNFTAIPDTIVDTFGVVLKELSTGLADKAQAMNRAQLNRPTPYSKGGPEPEEYT